MKAYSFFPRRLLIPLWALLICMVPQAQAQEKDPFEELKKTAGEIQAKLGEQIKIINDNLQYIEMFDHGRLVFLRESSQIILEAIKKDNILKVPEADFISTLRKYRNAQATVLGREGTRDLPGTLGLCPKVAREPFRKLFALATEWAKLKGISEKIKEPQHTFDMLQATEQHLTTIHDTVRSVALAATGEEKTKMEKLEKTMVELIERISRAKREAEVKGDTSPVVNDTAVPIIYDVRKVGEEMVAISPLQQGEVGTVLFVMVGTVENFVDAKDLSMELQKYDKKMRGSSM